LQKRRRKDDEEETYENIDSAGRERQFSIF
jgi:hypothetical protein